jgi:Holliday junction DNA helicase RuvA
MIAHLSGKLLSKQATSVIVDVSGVGYEVTIPLSTFYDLEDLGSTVQLRIYTHVREDALQLYGFKTARERELFLKIISVTGIGPKLGITLLSGMSADEMVASIRTNNLARLTLIPGVGRKTAERLIMARRSPSSRLPRSKRSLERNQRPAPRLLKTLFVPTLSRLYSISATSDPELKKRSMPHSKKRAS